MNYNEAVSTDRLSTCWPWSHKWGSWIDKYIVRSESVIHGGLVGEGVEQERHCLKCNKIQLHITWSR